MHLFFLAFVHAVGLYIAFMVVPFPFMVGWLVVCLAKPKVVTRSIYEHVSDLTHFYPAAPQQLTPRLSNFLHTVLSLHSVPHPYSNRLHSIPTSPLQITTLFHFVPHCYCLLQHCQIDRLSVYKRKTGSTNTYAVMC